MDRLPREVFTYILLLLNPKDRVECSYVNKSWSTKIRQGSILFNDIQCHSLLQNGRIMELLGRNIDLRLKVKTLRYELLGRFTIQQINDLPEKFPKVRHFEYFVCEAINREASSATDITNLDLRNLNTSFPKCNFLEITKYEFFIGWSELQSIKETSSSMYTLFILKRSTQPFVNLSRIWLNFVHIHEIYPLTAMDCLTAGLKNAPNLVDLTIQHAPLNLAHVDSINQQCLFLKTLSLHSVMLFKHRILKESTAENTFIVDFDTDNSTEATSNLVSLSITDSIYEIDLPLFSYIGENYKKLEHLVCSNASSNCITNNTSAQAILDHCHYLKTFKCNLFEWTGPFIALIDQQTDIELQDFTIDISDWAVNTFMSLCRSRRLGKALKYLTFNFYQVPESLDTNILAFVNLVELHINYDCYLDNDDGGDVDSNEQVPVPPAIPFTALLQACKHLNYLSVGHLPIIVDRIPSESHSIQSIHLTGCSLGSFDRNYSVYNCISNFCLQLVDLEIQGGNYKNTLSIRELTLDLLNHKSLSSLTPLTNSVYRYIKHLDKKGNNHWYYVSRVRPSTTYQVYHTLVKPPYDKAKAGKYLTIKCENRNVFYRDEE